MPMTQSLVSAGDVRMWADPGPRVVGRTGVSRQGSGLRGSLLVVLLVIGSLVVSNQTLDEFRLVAGDGQVTLAQLLAEFIVGQVVVLRGVTVAGILTHARHGVHAVGVQGVHDSVARSVRLTRNLRLPVPRAQPCLLVLGEAVGLILGERRTEFTLQHLDHTSQA